MDKTTVEELQDSKQRQELMELLAERAKHTRIRKEAEEMEKVCTEALIPLLNRMNLKTIDADDDQGNRRRFVVVNGANSHIDRQLLLMKGVDPAKIDECTKRTTFTTLQMRNIKDT